MRYRSWLSWPALLLFLTFAPSSHPQAPQTGTLKAIHAEGMKTFSEAQVAAISGLQVDSQVGRQDLQNAADLLLRSGLFAKVNYKFDTHNNDVILTFHVEEAPRLPVAYDNFPWFDDSELTAAIKNDLPFYDGTLPEGGTVVDLAGNALASFLTAHGLKAEVKHFVLANPLLDSSEQEFQLSGVTQTVASVEFSDPALTNDLAVQQHLSDVRGKPYSRLMIDVFLAEAIRPIYLAKGYLRAKIGPAEVRLSGDPNKKFPEAIPVYVPCTPGPVFHWKEADWKGNGALSSQALDAVLRMKPGDLADGMAIEGAWDRVREAYGHLGYLDAKVEPVASYDEQAHTVSYSVAIVEGQQYRYQEMTVTGMSLAGERMIRDAWPLKPGDVMDKTAFEQFLLLLEAHRDSIFKDLPVHYDTVGHWLETDPQKGTANALIDFK
ncbi:MAG TPA: POTRA domain-containing protein [Candidatus Eremiobacteraceae bacterium]|nr:POTRA domain-containing protein [Candidatus Eremiobacteraceae bacterium]